MGQYYKPTIMNEECKVVATLYSWDYHSGLKLMEHSYLGNPFVNAVCSRIVDHPMRIAWIGDYSTDPWDGTEPYQQKVDKDVMVEAFEAVWGENSDAVKIAPEPVAGLETPADYEGWYIVNHTRKAYVDLGAFQKVNGWDESWDGKKYRSSIHPLPLLTACGNDRGGGDYHSCYPDWDKVGVWAFDLIELSKNVPSEYACEEYFFKEE